MLASWSRLHPAVCHIHGGRHSLWTPSSQVIQRLAHRRLGHGALAGHAVRGQALIQAFGYFLENPALLLCRGLSGGLGLLGGTSLAVLSSSARCLKAAQPCQGRLACLRGWGSS